MSGPKRWYLAMVRMDPPDDLGRTVTAEVVPVNTQRAKALRVRKRLEHPDLDLNLGGALVLLGEEGIEDGPAVREALDLKPRPSFQRGREAEHTGVAGVAEDPAP